MNPADLMDKASRAVASAKLLLGAGDVDGACNRAYLWAIEQAASFVDVVQREFAPR